MKIKNISALLLGAVLLAQTVPATADAATDSLRYRRSSLCSFLVKHTEDKFADEIEQQFLNIPIDGQFNDHNLSVRVVSVNNTADHAVDMANFVENNQLASRLVAKWFNRNYLTGECDLELVKSRGLYDASALDRELASRSALGNALLEDAGEDLIGKTYVLMNEITYVDRGAQSAAWGAVFGAVAAGVAAGFDLDADLAQGIGAMTNAVISSYKGFAVRIRTLLFRLVWDETTANMFYTKHFADRLNPELLKIKDAFESDRPRYRMEYVGEIISKGGKTSFLGINEEEPQLMVRKACQRALEENISDLQVKYEEFRIKSPIVTVSPTITAQIGLKEGITPATRFEVLETVEKDGRREYRRVGIVKPVANRIWDNRFMAKEEGAYGADFGCTTFQRVSGGDFYPGLLLRRID